MIILGLHFGHDASVSIIKDGKVLLCYEKERGSRIKHAMGLAPEDIDIALQDAGMKPSEVNYATLTSTQQVEIVLSDPENLAVKLQITPSHNWPCTMTNRMQIMPDKMKEFSSGWLKYVFENRKTHPYHKFFPTLGKYVDSEERLVGSFEYFINLPLWDRVMKFDAMRCTDYSEVVTNPDIQHGFHYPGVLQFRGREIPAYFFSHHFAHLAYAFYSSPFKESAILTHDGGGGGVGYGTGLFGYGKRNRLYPLGPNHLVAGELYDCAGMRLGFDESGAPGKLMGLSAYGSPVFFDQSFVGNWHDLDKSSPDKWIAHCEKEARKRNYDLTAFGDQNRILEPINVDFAASTQKLAEEMMMVAVKTLFEMLKNSSLKTKNLSLAGGVALNCPANTRLWQESNFKHIHVPPAVGDMGLSTGSALALYFHIMDHARTPESRQSNRLAFLGLHASCSTQALEQAIRKYQKDIQVEKTDNAPKSAATDLAENKIVGWFEGRSEIGPRALGHRSILANPTIKENWWRVNEIKGREFWRPFAPSILEGKEKKHFRNSPLPSYFMLFNSITKSKKLPAVTHADGSARIQSVPKTCGKFYQLIAYFEEMVGIPVVLNTSFNGPGEPIVEKPEEAVAFLLKTKLDCLYIGNYKISKLR